MALFGFVLRDNFRPDSDIDVLVVFDPSAFVTFTTLGKMKRELSNIFQIIEASEAANLMSDNSSKRTIIKQRAAVEL